MLFQGIEELSRLRDQLRRIDVLASIGSTIAGMAHEVELSIQLQPLSSCSNDNFADAELVKGKDVYFDARSVLGATIILARCR